MRTTEMFNLRATNNAKLERRLAEYTDALWGIINSFEYNY